MAIGLRVDRADQEVREPALVLGPALPWAVDAAHPEHHRGDLEAVGIVEDVLIGGALRAAVGRAKREPAMLANPVGLHRVVDRTPARAFEPQRQIGQAPVHLVGGREHDRRRFGQVPDGLEELERAAGVHREVVARIDEAGRHRHLAGQVEDAFAAGDQHFHKVPVAYVANVDLQEVSIEVTQVSEVMLDPGTGQVVENHYGPAGLQQPIRQVRSDEAVPPVIRTFSFMYHVPSAS